MYIKQKLIGKSAVYQKGELYLIDVRSMVKLKESLEGIGLSNAVEYMPITSLWKPFNEGDYHEMLIVRTGGIGDLLALSSIAQYCSLNTIKFVTAKSMFPVFRWFASDNIFPKSVEEPIYRQFHPTRIPFIQKHTKRFWVEGLIEQGSSENWYDIFFGMLGVEKLDTAYMRPNLIQYRLPGKSGIDTSKRSILITHRATSQMRSMEFRILYEAIREVTADMGEIHIYVHSDNLTEADWNYLGTVNNDDNLHIILARDIERYLLDCYDATVSVSVDTAALHFREGVGKPAIGIYAAFTADCRTRYYQVTHSFNLKSDCDMQPCFIHQNALDHVCPKAMKGDRTAPCMGSSLNPTVFDQIREGIRDYLRKNLQLIN